MVLISQKAKTEDDAEFVNDDVKMLVDSLSYRVSRWFSLLIILKV